MNEHRLVWTHTFAQRDNNDLTLCICLFPVLFNKYNTHTHTMYNKDEAILNFNYFISVQILIVFSAVKYKQASKRKRRRDTQSTVQAAYIYNNNNNNNTIKLLCISFNYRILCALLCSSTEKLLCAAFIYVCISSHLN